MLCCCDLIRLFRRETERIKREEENFRKTITTKWIYCTFKRMQSINADLFSYLFKRLFSFDKKYCKHDNILYKVSGDISNHLPYTLQKRKPRNNRYTMYVVTSDSVSMKTIVLMQPRYVTCEFSRILESLENWTRVRNYYALYFT